MVGCEIDRGRPDLPDAELPRDRHDLTEPRPHSLVEGPVDLTSDAWRLGRVTPPEQEAALFESPVETLADVEHHRLSLDVECGMGLEDAHRVACPARGDPDAGGPSYSAQAWAAGQDDAFRRNPTRGRLDAGHAFRAV